MTDFFPQPIPPVVPTEEMEVFVEGLDHPEGLAFDADGVLWAGGEAGQIYSLANGKLREVANVGGFCLGLTFSRSQNLFVCNPALHALQCIDRSGRILQVIDRVGDRPLRMPNFSVMDHQGNLYFSDSGTWGGFDGCVYRLRTGGAIELFAGPFAFANGLALSASEDALFVAESQRDCVTRIPIRADATAGDADLYASGLARIPDGLVFDSVHNLYVTCYATDCIYRVRPDRTVELFAYDPEGTILARPTNAAFGGKDSKQLFVANLGRWHITALSTGAPGQRLAGEAHEGVAS